MNFNKMDNNELEQEEKKPQNFLRKWFRLKHIIGMVAGGTAGFLYYYYIGCASGSCALKSNPYYNIVLGILLGYLIADMIRKKK